MPVLEIGNVNYPELLEYGPQFSVNFDILKESFSSPKDVEIIFKFNNQETKWDLDSLDASQKYNVNLDKRLIDPKDNSFSIIVNYYDDRGDSFTKEYEKALLLKDPGFLARVSMWLSRLSRGVDSFIQGIGSKN